MSKLFLHIGHGKTGSSYIQSVLARSIEILKGFEIIYPEPVDAEAAATGAISSGNGYCLNSFLQDKEIVPNANYLFSSEFFFFKLLDPQLQEKLIGFAEEFSMDIEILLFIRDPISYACSSYQQMVKRGGLSASLSSFLTDFDYLKQVNQALDAVEGFPNTKIKVVNYSACDALVPVVEEWLGIAPDSLLRPPTRIVNRSLTIGELELQRQVNLRLGSSGSGLADRLCTELPDIPADNLRPSLAEQEQLWERLVPEIDGVNNRVDPCARYIKERDVSSLGTVADPQKFYFSGEQLAVVASLLVAEPEQLEKLRLTAARLEALQASHEALSELHRSLRERHRSLQARHHALRNSLSWKLTAPLRAVRARLRRLAGTPAKPTPEIQTKTPRDT